MLEIFKKAQKNKYAIGQFNVSNMDQIRAIMQAAQKMRSPAIIATSEGESDFMGKKQTKALVDSWRMETGLPVILHLDHGKDFNIIQEAIEAGYDSVHFDGSKLPFEENIKITKKIVDFARKNGIRNIEGELGYLKGQSAIHKAVEIDEKDLTDPNQVLEFAERTGIDSLAVAVGNIHGIFEGGENPHLFLNRLKEIHGKLNDSAILVLHGGSGIPEEDIEQSIQLGIVKININTELRVAYIQALKKSLFDNPEETTPYKIMPLVIEAVQKVVEEKIKLFGSENKL